MRVFLAALLAVSATLAQGADSDGKFAVDGVGNRNCRQFVEAMEEKGGLAIAFASWTEGFVTATNALRDDTFDLTPWQTIEVIALKLRGYCEKNPDEVYMLALGKLVSVLNDDRMARSDEIVRVETDGRAVFVYRRVLEQVRQKLAERGQDIPQQEGVFDQVFVEALRSLQAQTGIPQSGLPDQQTMIALFEGRADP